MSVEVFKTNIDCPDAARLTLAELQTLYPAYTLSFDLEDCDRILKVAAPGHIASEDILAFIRSKKYRIEMLD